MHIYKINIQVKYIHLSYIQFSAYLKALLMKKSRNKVTHQN